MKKVKYIQIKERLTNDIKRKSLIPIIGSGFSRGCITENGGKVPSGQDFQIHMLEEIKKTSQFSKEEYEEIEGKKFSGISTIYNENEIVPSNQRRLYLKRNFTKVILEKPEQKSFINLDWQYIYTLNIDDAIEKNSIFTQVVYANREPNEEVFQENKCVIKLHGDVSDIITYSDSVCEIFDEVQYATSIDKNKALLTRLKHDYEYQNILYIGCSLEDEIDLVYASHIPSVSATNRYFCHVGPISKVAEINLKKYGITYCVEFENYEEMYNSLVASFQEAQKVQTNELTNYCSRQIIKLGSGFEKNSPYLFQGKSPSADNNFLTIPSFFIHRKITETIIKNMSTYTLQILRGQGCSGKTYIGIELTQLIRDRDVYLFETKDGLSDNAFYDMLSRSNLLLIFDYRSLSQDQIEYLIQHVSDLHEKNDNVILISSKSDRDLPSILNYSSNKGTLDEKLVYIVDLPNMFSKEETQELNMGLVKSSFGVFDEKKSIVDNILSVSRSLTVENKYSQISPKWDNERFVISLLLLAIKRKITSKEAVEFGIEKELEEQCEKATPLIEKDYSKKYEITPKENSPVKYVLNASYWLSDFLSNYVKDSVHYSIVVLSFQKIIKSIIALKGTPKLCYTEKNAPYKDFILFDNITNVFKDDSTLFLIKDIYVALNDDLSTDPNYLHQRSKCFIRLSDVDKDTTKKEEYLNKALRDANAAYSIFDKRYNEYHNDKVFISASHALYTKALSMCHLCVLRNYVDKEMNTLALDTLILALKSPYNIYANPKIDRYNYGDDVFKFFTKVLNDKSCVNSNKQSEISELFRLLKNRKT